MISFTKELALVREELVSVVGSNGYTEVQCNDTKSRMGGRVNEQKDFAGSSAVQPDSYCVIMENCLYVRSNFVSAFHLSSNCGTIVSSVLHTKSSVTYYH